MSINSLNPNAISGPRLADFLSEGEKSNNLLGNQQARNSINSTAISALSGQNSPNEDFLQISLSSIAIEKMKSGYNINTGSVYKETTVFIEDFFKEQGVDLESLSDNAKKFLSDLYERFGSIENARRDIATDYLESQSSDEDAGIFTLAGDKQRFRLKITENDQGIRQLSILDVNLKTNKTDLFTINLDAQKENIAVERTTKDISTVNYTQQGEEVRRTAINLY